MRSVYFRVRTFIILLNLLHNQTAVHGLVSHTTILVANEKAFSRFVKGRRQGRNLPGQDLHVDICAFQIEAVLHIFAGQIKGNFRSGWNTDFIGLKDPGLGQNVGFILAWREFTHTFIYRRSKWRRTGSGHRIGVYLGIGRGDLYTIGETTGSNC